MNADQCFCAPENYSVVPYFSNFCQLLFYKEKREIVVGGGGVGRGGEGS